MHVTPYEKRMAESKQRKSKILRLARQKKADGTPKYTQVEIAAEIQCTKAYVGQVLKGAKA
jgi:hypothetical protein